MFFGKIRLILLQERYFECNLDMLNPASSGEESNSISPYDSNTSLHLHQSIYQIAFAINYI